MVYTQHSYAGCGSEHIHHNGTQDGQLKRQCKSCGYQARFAPAAVVKAAQYAQVEALFTEGKSQRSIVRANGAARMTIAKLIKNKRRWPRPGCHVDKQKRPSGRSPKSGNWTICGPSSAGVSAKSSWAGRRTGLAPPRGLGAGLSRGRHGPAVVRRASAALLALSHRPI